MYIMEDDRLNEIRRHTEGILHLWLVAENKNAALHYYNKLSPFGRELFLGVLKDVISQSDNIEFRQAAKDIPNYIKQSMN